MLFKIKKNIFFIKLFAISKLLVLLFLLNARSLFSQDPTYFSITSENGLPSNEVYCMIQDNKGFIARPVGRIVFGFGQSKPDPQDPFSPTAIWMLNLDAAARYDLIGETYVEEKFHPMLRGSLDFFILYRHTRPYKRCNKK